MNNTQSPSQGPQAGWHKKQSSQIWKPKVQENKTFIRYFNIERRFSRNLLNNANISNIPYVLPSKKR